MVDGVNGASASQNSYQLSSDPAVAQQQVQDIAVNDPVITDLINRYGVEAVAQALSNSYTEGFVEQLKAEIDSRDDLSQAMKDEAKAKIDEAMGSLEANAVDPMLQEEMDASTLGQQAKTAGGEEASELSAQADAEVAGEEGAGGNQLGMVEDEDENNTKGGKGGGSWLIALAKGLAEVQSKFLDDAMANLDTMNAETANAVGGADSGAFIEAQAKFQANMKMFGMASEATSTTLKTIGEALMSLSRKQ